MMIEKGCLLSIKLTLMIYSNLEKQQKKMVLDLDCISFQSLYQK